MHLVLALTPQVAGAEEGFGTLSSREVCYLFGVYTVQIKSYAQALGTSLLQSDGDLCKLRLFIMQQDLCISQVHICMRYRGNEFGAAVLIRGRRHKVALYPASIRPRLVRTAPALQTFQHQCA